MHRRFGAIWQRRFSVKKTFKVCIFVYKDVIASVNKYVKSIQIMYFFNASKLQKKINELIEKAKSFVVFFNNLYTFYDI